MTTHLEHEIQEVKQKLFAMADLAIEAITNGIQSLKKSDESLAEVVVRRDSEIDRLEIEIDDDCIRILVTKQPAAVDLRLVLAMLKINTDLERIGDLATAMAKETIRLNGKPTMKPLIDLPKMAEIAVEMIKDSLRAITEKNVILAEQVIARDIEIDELNIQVFRELFTYMDEHHNRITEALGLIMVSKALERIGDHATNIAERAIYYIKGIDVRHGNC